jgi:cobalt-zinc-cadmium resistance protein CzcA
LIPIFSFQKVEGKMFTPLAYTLGFALAGRIAVYAHAGTGAMFYFTQKNVREKSNPIVRFFDNMVRGF